MSTNKILGGILLVAGTTIGAGMLGIPVITAFAGFWPSLLLIVLCWALMFVTGFFFLDVNLSIPGGPNFISIAEKMLGRAGKWATWFFYLLLLYSLLAAYMAGGAPLVMEAVLSLTGISLPPWGAALAFPLLLGGFIYCGTRRADFINRLLCVGLILSYGCLVALIPPHAQIAFLNHRDPSALLVAMSVLFTSFGYHIIIPSLTVYMEYNRRALRSVIAIGSAIPLIVYLVWLLLVHSSLSLSDLALAWQRGEPATVPLAALVQHPLIAFAARSFSFFAIITSFLGCSLALFHFLMDGLQLKKRSGHLLSMVLTFVPPLLFVFFYAKGFYFALQYAGAIVAVLLAILPSCMAWKLQDGYRSKRARLLLVAVMACSLFVIAFDFLSTREFRESFIAKYTMEKNVNLSQ